MQTVLSLPVELVAQVDACVMLPDITNARFEGVGSHVKYPYEDPTRREHGVRAAWSGTPDDEDLMEQVQLIFSVSVLRFWPSFCLV
jgi:hypothetical protein